MSGRKKREPVWSDKNHSDSEDELIADSNEEENVYKLLKTASKRKTKVNDNNKAYVPSEEELLQEQYDDVDDPKLPNNGKTKQSKSKVNKNNRNETKFDGNDNDNNNPINKAVDCDSGAIPVNKLSCYIFLFCGIFLLLSYLFTSMQPPMLIKS